MKQPPLKTQTLRCAFSTLILLLLPVGLLAQTYHLTDLGTGLSGTNSCAHGINSQGQVVGYWDTLTNGYHAFLYNAGTMTDLGSLGGTNSYALSINASADVTGFSETTNAVHAFLYSSESLTSLGAMGGLNSYALWINAAQKIAGYIDTTNGANAVLYDNGTVTSLGTLGGTNSYAYGINVSNLMVGASLLAGNAATNAFLWNSGTLSNLNDLIPTNSGWQLLEARAINDSGDIAGWGLTNNQERAFLFSQGTVTDVGILSNGTNSYALALNDASVVVGAATTNGLLHAVRWQNSALADLNGLIPLATGWELREARGINGGGQIVGWGMINNQEHAYLLTPNVLPSVALTLPTNNTVFAISGDITLQATASDSDGSVAQVQFFAGATSLGTDTTSPYGIVWPSVAPGTNSLTAVATDNSGETNPSATVTIVVNAPPAPPPVDPVLAQSPFYDPNDHTPPIITLILPLNAVLLP